MKWSGNLAAAVLALLASFAGHGAGAVAGPRSQPEPALESARRVTDPRQIEDWLRRLVGRYEFEGMIQAVSLGDCAPLPTIADEEYKAYSPLCGPIKGKGDCVGIGKGPGVHCVLNVFWTDITNIVQPNEQLRGGAYAVPGGVSNLDPSMMLFGIDPGESGITYLLVDNKGLPEGATGFLAGNRASFSAPCVNATEMFSDMDQITVTAACKRKIRIDAKPEARVLHWSMDIEIEVGGVKDVATRYEMTLRRVDQH